MVLLFNTVIAGTMIATESAATNAAASTPGDDYWGDDQDTSVITGNIKSDIRSLSELSSPSLETGRGRRGYPVNIRGVVTCVVQEHNALILQDQTHAVFVINASPTTPLPRRGQFLDVQGKSDKGTFAPLVRMTRMTVLGNGTLPESVQPTWDQLMNGSLGDESQTRFAEVAGELFLLVR